VTIVGNSVSKLLETRVRSLFAPSRAGGSGPGSVGVEVELLPVRAGQGRPLPVARADITAALDADPSLLADGRVTFEPGGQLELSPPPAAGPALCLSNLEALLRRVHRCGEAAGITFLGTAVSPWHDVEEIGLQNDHPRYCAMQAHFDAIGPAGRRMMRQTAALQICVDLDGPDRWQMLNRVGPALSAAFAGSPVLAGRPTGCRSTRTAIWLDTDPSRTGFDGSHLGDDPASAYTALALDAQTILLPRESEPAPPAGVPLRALLAKGEGRPDADDIDHHLTTLFPPVRPHGYLETRYLDAMPWSRLEIAVCLLATLAADARATREALAAVGRGAMPCREAWCRSAMAATSDDALAETATTIFNIALRAIPRLPAGYLPDGIGARMAAYRDRFPATGRCPADEMLEGHRADPQEVGTWL